jgi:imidazolonepropionase-like amidohydrolase
MNRARTIASLLGLLMAGNTAAQSLFIDNATVYTMGPEGTLQRGDLLIRNGRIERIGIDLEPPADAEVIEAAGRPLTPGLFAGITQLGLVEIGAVEDSSDSALAVNEALNVTGLRPEFDITRAYNPHSTVIPVTRIEGYTWTMLGAQPSGSMVGGRGRAVRLDGGYDSFVSAPVLFVDIGGDASSRSGGSRAAQWMLLEQALDEAETKSDAPDNGILTERGRRVLRRSMEQGVIVFDADRASDIAEVIRFSRQHELKSVITGATEAWMLADELAEAGIPVLVNALSNLPSSFDQLGARLDNAALLHEAGVPVAFTGAGTHNARKLRQLAGNAVAAGLPYVAALEALTTVPANMFGIDDNLAYLARGSRADLVLWSGDPLEVTSAADLVIIGGQADPMVSRQTLLRDRYLPKTAEKPRAYITSAGNPPPGG